jgi:hypothetical protein
VLCGLFWVAKPPQPDLKHEKKNKVYLLEMLHTTIQVKKNFCFLGKKIFLKKFDEKFIFWRPLNYVKLAENMYGMREYRE